MPLDLTLAADLVGWLRAMQMDLHRGLAAAVRAVQGEHALSAALVLAGLSFLYGVFHAAGPGHGKAVISAYAATAERRGNPGLGRAVGLSLASAFMQAVVALLLVGTAFLVVGGGARWATRNAEAVLEPLSHGVIAAVGLWMMGRGLRALWRLRGPASRHDHHHLHHDHGHDHAHGACCAVAVPPSAGRGRGDWWEMAGIVLAVGARPCSGGLLVLALSFGLGLWAAGVAAVFAMAAGTGITVALLAVMARGSRLLAARLGSRLAGGETALHRWSAVVALAGGLLIAVLGLALLADSLARPVNPLLG